jgi:hypothetical protein
MVEIIYEYRGIVGAGIGLAIGVNVGIMLMCILYASKQND